MPFYLALTKIKTVAGEQPSMYRVQAPTAPKDELVSAIRSSIKTRLNPSAQVEVLEVVEISEEVFNLEEPCSE